jgi:hypothetical protein
MSRINPYSLTPTGETVSRTFEDPRQPGQVLTLTLRRPRGLVFDLALSEISSKRRAEYLDRPDKLLPVHGQIPLMSEGLCDTIALLEVLQIPAVGEAAYTFNEWCALWLTMPEAMEAVAVWVSGLVQEAQADLKNGSAARGKRSSAPPSAPTSPTRK